MTVTVALVLGFRKSDNLANAYGVAVSLTMLMTSVLLFIAMREVWRWNVVAAGAAAAVFLVVDSAFLSANLVKVLDGGYVPLLLACAIYGVMWLWRGGTEAVHARLADHSLTIEDFTARMVAEQTPRVPGRPFS